jgi:putative ABC transport system substrate-binding protein
VRRRQFITVLGGAVALPLAARAQQAAMPVVGVLIAIGESDPEAQARVTAFRQGLEALGRVDRRKVRIDYHYVAGDVDRAGRDAAEMVTQAVNVIVVNSSPLLMAVQQRTRTVPIVFVQVGDPVGGGFVESLSHPGGNTTGFTTFEYSFAAKWVELLKAAPP